MSFRRSVEKFGWGAKNAPPPCEIGLKEGGFLERGDYSQNQNYKDIDDSIVVHLHHILRIQHTLLLVKNT